MKNIQGIILVAVVVAALVAGGFLLASPAVAPTSTSSSPVASGQPADVAILHNAGAPVVGSKDAKVKIIVFSDFLCPYCKTAHGVMNDVLSKNTYVSIEYRNLIVHADSRILAEAAEAANMQGKFREMNDALFSKTVATNKDAVIALAKELNLNLAKFESDLGSSTVKAQIDQDEKDAAALRLQGTPSIFLNNVAVDNFTELDSLVNKALGK